MDAQSAFQLSFDFLRSKRVVVEPSAGHIRHTRWLSTASTASCVAARGGPGHKALSAGSPSLGGPRMATIGTFSPSWRRGGTQLPEQRWTTPSGWSIKKYINENN